MTWKQLLKSVQPQDAGGVNPNQAALLDSQVLHETNSKNIGRFLKYHLVNRSFFICSGFLHKVCSILSPLSHKPQTLILVSARVMGNFFFNMFASEAPSACASCGRLETTYQSSLRMRPDPECRGVGFSV